jgi:hypothetical protein
MSPGGLLSTGTGVSECGCAVRGDVDGDPGPPRVAGWLAEPEELQAIAPLKVITVAIRGFVSPRILRPSLNQDERTMRAGYGNLLLEPTQPSDLSLRKGAVGSALPE